MEKLNIVHVTSYFPPHLGGMENCILEIVKIQSKKNNVSVFTSDIGYKNKKVYDKAYYLPSFEFAHTPIIFSLFTKLLSIPKNSIMHLHVAQAYVPEIVFIVSKIRKIPYVAHVHLDVDSSGFFGFLLEPYKKIFLGLVLRNAAKVICLTHSQKKFIANKYKIKLSRLEVIPNGVNEEYFIKRKTLMRSSPQILFVGRLSPQKNIGFLIEAFSYLPKNISFDIVGDGEDREKIQNLIREKKLKNVKIHGIKKGRQLLEFYRKADLFVISSTKEGVSLAMLEALAAGLPIVALKAPGVSEIIDKTGILVLNPNPLDFAKGILSLVNSKKRLLDMSSRAIKKAKLYSWDNTVSQIEKVYLKLNYAN